VGSLPNAKPDVHHYRQGVFNQLTALQGSTFARDLYGPVGGTVLFLEAWRLEYAIDPAWSASRTPRFEPHALS
jgi:hypothetical protein